MPASNQFLHAHHQKTYHRAKFIDNSGNASALCFASPRPINLRRASWTIVDASVTCPKCKRIMKEARDG